MTNVVRGNILNIPQRKFFPGEIVIENGEIVEINVVSDSGFNNVIMPGFIDSHVHIESSMLVPSEFARLAVRHGTVGVVTDPHEIANVVGEAGVNFMIDDGKRIPFNFFFGAPSCVPATSFETSGARLDSDMVDDLLSRDDIYFLSEMMNFPGVLSKDGDVMKKLAAAKKYSKPVDGHAPGLGGDDLALYIDSGISTDHECRELEEGRDKCRRGMKVLIREGSAAKDFELLHPLISEVPKMCMFCSDDKHPDDLLVSHINALVNRAVSHGHNIYDVLQVACLNALEHYKLNVGQLRVGDPADFIVVDNSILSPGSPVVNVQKTYIGGECVYAAEKEKSASSKTLSPAKPLNNYYVNEVTTVDLAVPLFADAQARVPVIGVTDGQLFTQYEEMLLPPSGDSIEGCVPAYFPEEDTCKIVVLNRYRSAKPQVGYIRGFGLKKGALASSVAHDCHNVVVVGCSDQEIVAAIAAVNKHRGGIVAVVAEKDGTMSTTTLPLPVAGIISNLPGEQVAELYSKIDSVAKIVCGSTLSAPFMTLSFMALLVIPEIKLSDRGLFDGRSFAFIKNSSPVEPPAKNKRRK